MINQVMWYFFWLGILYYRALTAYNDRLVVVTSSTRYILWTWNFLLLLLESTCSDTWREQVWYENWIWNIRNIWFLEKTQEEGHGQERASVDQSIFNSSNATLAICHILRHSDLEWRTSAAACNCTRIIMTFEMITTTWRLNIQVLTLRIRSISFHSKCSFVQWSD